MTSQKQQQHVAYNTTRAVATTKFSNNKIKKTQNDSAHARTAMPTFKGQQHYCTLQQFAKTMPRATPHTALHPWFTSSTAIATTSITCTSRALPPGWLPVPRHRTKEGAHAQFSRRQPAHVGFEPSVDSPQLSHQKLVVHTFPTTIIVIFFVILSVI